MTGLEAVAPARSPARRGSSSRAVFVAPAGICVLAGLYAAVQLVLDPGDPSPGRLPDMHGILMVLGFLGTLIGLERAVALRRPWGYAAPLALGAGGLALVLPLPVIVGQILLVAGSGLTVAVLQALWGRQRDAATATQVLAAMLAVGASGLWTRLEVAATLPWLAGFAVLTICAERVELARVALPTWAPRVLLSLAVALTAAVVAALVWPEVGTRVLGVVLAGMVGWLARVDVARRTIHSCGLARFATAALLLGYAWLAFVALAWTVAGPPVSPAAYDSVVHATFLGFAMSMVMAHAPVILPAVLRRPLPYHPVMWAPLVLLHAGLLLRVPVGNGLGLLGPWQIGALSALVAVVSFLVCAAWSVLTASPEGRSR